MCLSILENVFAVSMFVKNHLLSPAFVVINKKVNKKLTDWIVPQPSLPLSSFLAFGSCDFPELGL